MIARIKTCAAVPLITAREEDSGSTGSQCSQHVTDTGRIIERNLVYASRHSTKGHRLLAKLTVCSSSPYEVVGTWGMGLWQKKALEVDCLYHSPAVIDATEHPRNPGVKGLFRVTHARQSTHRLPAKGSQLMAQSVRLTRG